MFNTIDYYIGKLELITLIFFSISIIFDIGLMPWVMILWIPCFIWEMFLGLIGLLITLSHQEETTSNEQTEIRN